MEQLTLTADQMKGKWKLNRFLSLKERCSFSKMFDEKILPHLSNEVVRTL